MTDHLKVSPSLVRERIEGVGSRIADLGRDPAAVRIVGVTKTFGLEAVEAAVAAGISDIGENYAAELVQKARALSQQESAAPVRWHYLGAVQRRKVRELAGFVSCFHGVCRVSEAEEIAKHCPSAEILVQVDFTGIPGRNGCRIEEVDDLVPQIRELRLNLTGLMTVAPPGPVEQARRAFSQLAEKAASLGLSELSMGMSDDYEVAIEEGSTMLRLGRTLFGERPGTN